MAQISLIPISKNRAQLQIFLNPKDRSPPSVQAFAVGFLEGAIDPETTWQSFSAGYIGALGSMDTPIPKKFVDFVNQNLGFMENEIAANKDSAYWIHVDIVLNQLRGLVRGYTEYMLEPTKVFYFTTAPLSSILSPLSSLLSSLL